MAGKSRIGESYLQVTPVLDGLSDAIAAQVSEGMGKASKETASESEEVGKESGEKMAKGVAIAAGAGVIAAAIGAQFIKGYENAMEQIGADTDVTARLNLDVGQSDEMSEAVKSLYTGAYGESYTAVAEDMESIMGTIQGAREMNSEELEKMGRDMSNLTSQYEADAGEISMAVNGIIGTGFAADADEAFQIVHNGFQTMGEHGDAWIDTLREFSGEFKTFGFEGDAAIQLMNAGMDAGIMDPTIWADALNEMNILIGDGSADESLIAMGMDPDQIRKDIAAGGDVAQTAFLDIFKSLQEKGDKNLFAGVMGSVAEDYAYELENGFKDINFDTLNEGLGESVQTLDEFDAAVNNGIDDQFLEIQRTFEQAFTDSMIPILETLLPIIQSIVDVLTENQWILTILVPLLGVVMVGALILMSAALWSVAAAGWAALTPLLPIIGTILLVVAAIALVIAAAWLIYKNWDVIWGGIKNIAGAVADWFVGLWTGISTWFGDVMNWIADFWTTGWGQIGDFFTGLWDGIVGWFVDTWNGVGDFFTGMWDGVVEWFVDIWNGVGDFFTGLWDSILDYFIAIYNEIKDKITDIIESVPGGSVVVSAVEKVGSWFGGPKMANGGTVKATPGGTLAMLGEAGRDEVVMDSGKWNKLLDKLNSEKSSGSVNPIVIEGITINQQPGESSEELLQRLNADLHFRGLRS